MGTVLICLFLFGKARGQKKNSNFVLNIKRASSPIVIDGVMNEAAWKQADVAGNFHMITPMDTSMANVNTEVRMTYDDNNLYLIAVCYYWNDDPNFVESLRRDWNFGRNDNFIYAMDTFDDLTNGFTFGTNADGAQWDGVIFEGNRVDLSWDNKWISSVKNYEDRYVFEMALPFKTIRYKEGIQEWGINFSRNDLKSTEKSGWAPVPRQFPSITLAYTGILRWDAPPPVPKTNISVIPYTLGRTTRDFENGESADFAGEFGADAKIAVTSSLNLDLTVNPDFSQVDVDQQVTNLDRFELFFPERRQFFLENGDLFANFGYDRIRPFFSRRIGLNAPILFGARLSGKINRDWRIGAMDMQTGKVDSIGLPAQNFSVVALQRRVFARSNVGLLFANRQSINYVPLEGSEEHTAFNRNAGLEFNLASANNVWTGKVLALKSFDPNKSGQSFTQAASLNYNTRNWSISGRYEYVGQNYTAEMGFVPRTGYIRFVPTISRIFFPKGSPILSHGPGAGAFIITDTDFRLTDNTVYGFYRVVFRSQDVFMGWTGYDYIKLLFPFDPTNSDVETIEENTEHTWNSFGFEYTSRPQSILTYSLSARFGGYYEDGTRQNTTLQLGYRYQPYVNLAIQASRDDIRLPQPWGNTVFWLVGPRLDITFTKNLYWTTFLQYNEQQENVNINTRLQWRYTPASDFFVVYTDNYLPEPWSSRNRALVFKLTYWWNL